MRRPRATKAERAHFEAHKERARILVHERLVYWNQFYKLSFNRVAIRNQGTRWGSCSTKGNLNFNYRLALLPLELVDYVVVHELCHLKHFNHGADFWNHVGHTIPDYKERVQALQAITKQIAIQGIQTLESAVHSRV